MPLLYRIANWEFFERDFLSTLKGWSNMTAGRKEELRLTCKEMHEAVKKLNKSATLSFEKSGKIEVVEAQEGARLKQHELFRLTFRPNGEIVADCDPVFRQASAPKTR